jgi:hypothetical protein
MFRFWIARSGRSQVLVYCAGDAFMTAVQLLLPPQELPLDEKLRALT